MPSQLGPLPVEITEPESAKFTAPLLLVHGLWSRAAAWRRFAGYLAHRGWRCLAVDLGAIEALSARGDALRSAITSVEVPPVVLGHDLGATLALRCGDVSRAIIALAPLVGPPFADPAPALRSAGSWLARRRAAPLRAPRGEWQTVYPNADLREPAGVVHDIVAGGLRLVPLPRALPALVFSGDHDRLLDVTRAAAFADRIGAEHQLLQGAGHAILDEPNWEDRVAAVHRWIIQRLGVDLLALYEEAWEGREDP
jgi:pimeloyl-ACP methyl ester carboxylesterase